MRDMEVQRDIKGRVDLCREVITYNIAAQKAHALRHSCCNRGTFPSLDPRLYIHNSSMELRIFAAEQHAIGGMRPTHIEQARRLLWKMHTTHNVTAKRHCQGCQASIMPRQGLLGLWTRGVFLVRHAHHLPVLAHHLRHMVPDCHDIGAVDTIGGDVYRRGAGEPATRHATVTVESAPQAEVASRNE